MLGPAVLGAAAALGVAVGGDEGAGSDARGAEGVGGSDGGEEGVGSGGGTEGELAAGIDALDARFGGSLGFGSGGPDGLAPDAGGDDLADGGDDFGGGSGRPSDDGTGALGIAGAAAGSEAKRELDPRFFFCSPSNTSRSLPPSSPILIALLMTADVAHPAQIALSAQDTSPGSHRAASGSRQDRHG